MNRMIDHQPGRRVVISEFGEDPIHAADNYLSVEPQEFPDVSALKSTDVVIRVKSAAVGWVDLLMSSGQYQHMASPPYCPGLEYSGVIAWAGADVRSTKVGDRVMADGLLTGPRSKGDYQAYGGFATYAVAPAKAAVALPERFSFDQGCNFFGNYETAYHCLITRGKLLASDTILIHGASGSTGLAALHLAKLVGATVIATGRSEEKLAAIRSEGADHTICTHRDSQGQIHFRAQIKELTQGEGVDVVYDSVGGDISLESLRCVKFGARFLIVGWAATPFVAKGRGQRGAPNANQLPTNLMMMKGLDVLGCPTAISTHRDPTTRAPRLQQLLRWVEAGKLTPHQPRGFDLADITEAIQAKWKSASVGGCVVHP